MIHGLPPLYPHFALLLGKKNRTQERYVLLHANPAAILRFV